MNPLTGPFRSLFPLFLLFAAAGNLTLASDRPPHQADVSLVPVKAAGLLDSPAFELRDLTVDDRGRPLILGQLREGPVALLRLTPEGLKDPSFGPLGDGTALFVQNTGLFAASFLRLQAGRLVVGGLCLSQDGTRSGCLFGTTPDASALVHLPGGRIIAGPLPVGPAAGLFLGGMLQAGAPRFSLEDDPDFALPTVLAGVDCATTRRIWQIFACGMDELMTIVKSGGVRKIRGALLSQIKRARGKYLAADRIADDSSKAKKTEKLAVAGTKAFQKVTNLYNSSRGLRNIPDTTRESMRSAVLILANRVANLNPSPSPSPSPTPSTGTKR